MYITFRPAVIYFWATCKHRIAAFELQKRAPRHVPCLPRGKNKRRKDGQIKLVVWLVKYHVAKICVCPLARRILPNGPQDYHTNLGTVKAAGVAIAARIVT